MRFGPNQRISCVLIDIIDDSFFEDIEEFEIVIVDVPGDDINTVGDGTTTVTITDNDIVEPAG